MVTNSLPIANFYASHRDIEVIVSGGLTYPRHQVWIGNLAVKPYQTLNADIAIMSGGGATENGVMNSHTLLIDLKRAMIASAQKVIFCLDQSKIGRHSFIPLCGWDNVDILVTNCETPNELLNQIEKQGVEFLLAQSKPNFHLPALSINPPPRSRIGTIVPNEETNSFPINPGKRRRKTTFKNAPWRTR